MGTGREAVMITPGLEVGTGPMVTPGLVEAMTGEFRRKEVQGRDTSLAGEEEEEEVELAGERTVTGERRTATEKPEGTREGVIPTLMVTLTVAPMGTLMVIPMAILMVLMATPIHMVTPPEAMVIPLTDMETLPMGMVIPLMDTVALTGEEMPGPANPLPPSELVPPTASTRCRA